MINNKVISESNKGDIIYSPLLLFFTTLKNKIWKKKQKLLKKDIAKLKMI